MYHHCGILRVIYSYQLNSSDVVVQNFQQGPLEHPKIKHVFRWSFDSNPSYKHPRSFGSRRGNDAVMVRGTFNHVRLNNKLVSKRASSLLPSSSPSPATTTLYLPTKTEMDIFDASEHYRKKKNCLRLFINTQGKTRLFSSLFLILK